MGIPQGKIERMEMWVDGAKKYTSFSDAIQETPTLAVGTHRIGFFAFNTAGQKWSKVVTITAK